MDPDEAARVLGVAPGTDPATLRSAYRRLIRARHPDRAGHDHTAAAARIIEAYAVLRKTSTPPPAPAPPSTTAPSPDAGDDGTGGRPIATALGEDTVVVVGPADLALRLLLDAAHDLGEVTYVDRSAGLVQMVVAFQGGPVCLLLVTMRRRGHRTEVHLDVDSLDTTPAPPVAAVVALLADTIRERAGIGSAER
jgi:hypothetical protein